MLECQGLLAKFLTIEGIVYPALVKEFYCNMEIKRSRGVTVINSVVENVKIILSPPKLAKLFQLQLVGVIQYDRESWIETETVGVSAVHVG